ncbi:hypothetical protein [uncultured Dysosmobacter sp.]|uniref:hypothetical protein n=1 Tax=uncultured Dysosmobacter sp. TaxID=2591384 RepID=UPI0026051E61|nr:hypothetical protein [uncultured Dysosmobacter sp.]
MGFCEFEDKAKFISARLLPLTAAATEGDVAGLDFEYRDGSETVTITYKDGTRQEVDVTGDTLLMLAQDVLGAVG